ncbi:MAG: HAD family phosphatase [Saprospiraceae bacterium]
MNKKIKAIIFDLDGTLVQTEILKAHAYGKAIEQLSEGRIKEDDVVVSFSELVGLSRYEIAEKLIKKYQPSLSSPLLVDVQTAIDLLIKTRLEIYGQMLLDPSILPSYACAFSTGLLKTARAKSYATGLATMSYSKQVNKVLGILKLEDHFQYIITRDDVKNGKPDPEIYLKMIKHLNIQPHEAIIIEDSVAGVKAAQAAGITVFGVTNSITKEAVNSSGLLVKPFLVNQSSEISERVFNYINNL